MILIYKFLYYDKNDRIKNNVATTNKKHVIRQLWYTVYIAKKLNK